MKLSMAEVEHIANLARLELTEAEKEQYRQQLSAILEHVARLQELDTEGIPPTSNVLPGAGRLRSDEPQRSLPIEDVLADAPDQKKDQFRVPPVLE